MAGCVELPLDQIGYTSVVQWSTLRNTLSGKGRVGVHSHHELAHNQIWGRMYGLRISPLIAYIFYPPFQLKKSACLKRVQDYPVDLNAFKVIHSFFSTFKEPKRQVKMATQSCTCSTDANAEKEPNFQRQNPSVSYLHSMMNTFSGNSDSDEKKF